MFLAMLHVRKGTEKLTECDGLFKLKLMLFGECAVMWTGRSNLATVSYTVKKRALLYPMVAGLVQEQKPEFWSPTATLGPPTGL